MLSIKGNLYTTACNYILQKNVFPTLWQDIGKGSQHVNVSVHKANAMKKWCEMVCKNVTGLPGPNLDLI